MTIKLSTCYYQIDMARGQNQETLPYTAGSNIGSLHGGIKTCEEAVVTPVTPVAAAAPVEFPNTGVGSTIA